MKVNRVTAGVLVVFVLGIAALAAWGERLGMSPEALRWVQTAAGVIGATVLAMLPRLLEDKDGDGIPDIIERSGPLLVLALLGASALTGCGSALTTQARAATIASIAVGSIGAELHDARASALDACESDAVPLHCESEQTSAWAPAVAAYESARLALSTWIDALDVARQAGAPDGDVLGALFVAVSRLAREWNQLAAALLAMRPDWPDLTLPPVVAALLGAGAAS